MSEINIVHDILKLMLQAQPGSAFIKGLYQQYCNKGGLSKRQLEGLLGKARHLSVISPARLATLEAIIKKKPTRERAAASSRKLVMPQRDDATAQLVQQILDKYPHHKRVLFLKAKIEKSGILDTAETAEVKKFAALLLK